VNQASFTCLNCWATQKGNKYRKKFYQLLIFPKPVEKIGYHNEILAQKTNIKVGSTSWRGGADSMGV
jgi:hypothetical protein